MVMNKNSNSSFQLELEGKILQELSKKYNVSLSSCQLDIDGIKFQVDGIDPKYELVFEIYCGIVNLKSGQTRKIASDILKLNTIEFILNKSITKSIVVIDENIYNQITNTNSWLCKCIKIFKINVIKIEMDENLINSLKVIKYRQYR